MPPSNSQIATSPDGTSPNTANSVINSTEIMPPKPTSSPMPSVEEIRAAVPKECFEKPLKTSLFYLGLDLAILGLLYLIVPSVERLAGWPGLLAWYWVMGMFMSSLFCIGHDCGHGVFSDYTWANDLFGHVAHAAIMVPFWPWQMSHRQHHKYTSHVDKDKGHPWVLEKDYEKADWIHRNFSKIPISGLLRWTPLYTIIGLPDGSHFWPFSKLFETNLDRVKCVVSVSACAFTSALVFSVFCNYSPLLFVKYYYVPLMFQGMWIVMITHLQHQDEEIEVYEEGHWNFIRGQLQTIDRHYGFGIDTLLHHITDGHVAHHFFFTKIPHYHLPAATRAIRKVLEKYPGAYKRRSCYHFLYEFLRLNVQLDCLVGMGTGLLKYKSTVTKSSQKSKKEL